MYQYFAYASPETPALTEGTFPSKCHVPPILEVRKEGRKPLCEPEELDKIRSGVLRTSNVKYKTGKDYE